jgi:hypothetical protein
MAAALLARRSAICHFFKPSMSAHGFEGFSLSMPVLNKKKNNRHCEERRPKRASDEAICKYWIIIGKPWLADCFTEKRSQ